jgi:cytochrome c oxidase subunit III
MPSNTSSEFVEPVTASAHSSIGSERAYVTGIVIALVGIAMFFIALLSAFVVRQGFPNNDWQPLAAPRILWLNTLILLASSFTMARSRKNFLAYREDGFRYWWGVTVILGSFFLLGQGLAWRELWRARIFLATNSSSSFFYVFTFSHMLHLLGGLAALLLVALRPTRHLTLATATQIAAIYWHFMGALWLCLFLLFLVSG